MYFSSWLTSINNPKMLLFPNTALAQPKQFGPRVTDPEREVLADNNCFILKGMSSKARPTYENVLPSLQ